MASDLTSVLRVTDKLDDGDEHEQATATFIRAVLAGETVDRALGALRRPGQRRFIMLARLARRDQLLCAAAATFFPGRPAAEQARDLHGALTRYASTAWLRDRDSRICPLRHMGRIEETCWQVLKARDQVLSADRIRRILVTST